jgi:hypothetical protein
MSDSIGLVVVAVVEMALWMLVIVAWGVVRLIWLLVRLIFYGIRRVVAGPPRRRAVRRVRREREAAIRDIVRLERVAHRQIQRLAGRRLPR